MSRQTGILLLVGIALGAYVAYVRTPSADTAKSKETTPAVKPADKKNGPDKKPHCPNWVPEAAPAVVGDYKCPCGCGKNLEDCDCCLTATGKPVLGGLTSPDGQVEALALPQTLDWPRNISSPPRSALGCCGFRAFEYAARWQGVTELINLPEWMIDHHIPGGDYPDKHRSIMDKYYPNISYWTDTSKNIGILVAAIKSQRMPCIDYSGRDPHYGGPIAHCVNVIACDVEKDWVAILDNNFPSTDEIVWMRVFEFRKRWGGWCYGLLAATPGIAIGDYKLPPQYNPFPIEGITDFGLNRPKDKWDEDCWISGQKSTPEQIIEALGPAMAPLINPKVDVDHKIDLTAHMEQILPLLLVGGAAYVLYQMGKGGSK